MQVVVDGLITNYSQVGKGRVVLLLHGWGDSLAGFRELQTAIGKDHMVVAVDLPGFGQTQAPVGVWGLDDYAVFVQSFISRLGLKVAVLVGHSNGGAIAIRGLASETIKADKLVLLSSAGIRGESKGKLGAIQLVTKTGKILTSSLPSGIRNKLRRKVYSAAGSDMLVAEHLQETFKKVVSQDVRADADNLTLPTLIIYGAEDRTTPASYGELFAELIKRSRLEIIDNAEHFVHHDQPEQVRSLIAEFIK